MGKESKSRGFFGWFLVLVILALVVGAVVYIIKKKLDHGNDNKPTPVPGPPGAIDHKYAYALEIAIQFFDVQTSGRLVDNKISWRGDSALTDGSEAKLDLSKGMYDAGDQVKFGFPMAFTATVLSWAILEYRDQMEAVNQLEPAQQSLKWITDFLLNAHPSPNVLYIQVGDPVTDHKCWDRPKGMTDKRPLTQVNASVPGTEVAAETAAAMASASLVFKTADSTYSTDQSYLEYVTGENGKEFAQWGSPTWFSWDNKLAGAQVLLSRLSLFGASRNSVIENYRKSAEDVMCGGLIWVSEWNSLQHPVASAFLAALYGDYMLTTQTAKLTCGDHSFEPSDLRKFAKLQADYVLGSNPLKMSFLVGYGDKYPQYVHHRGASIPVNATTGCTDGFQWLNSTKPNPNVAVGALVGGPFLNETFVDSRNNTMQTEPTTYNSAVIVGLPSSLVTTSSAVKSFG
ncbi:hypothetical protein Gogos_017944 [Gossypium gossypioides]|uniref:Endoglucanase n=1 Tax=Gossypium gossypioides TaxID=34282 RepID=A0A7J9BCJ4_GOSGO|nr:hypothetical protein [Gossypium gossypioides]